MAKKFWRVVLELVSHRLGHVARRFELLLSRFSQNHASRPKLGCTSARIRAGRIRQLSVSAASSYIGLAYLRSSDMVDAVSAKRGNIIIMLPQRSATRGALRATEVRGYTRRAYPRSADRHDIAPEHRGNK